ncbi:polysaccharide deacetylase family protein [Cycloclasticus zancles]|jgi:peptidoglycan/xylan/chitin deacetylase (PgdA/CDA1 family)|uniref:Polysaccharide deacetylase n=1 Tax=Cycloclasticus zancles 78-ME TaxID=1198232 RepID=S5TG28_9GAMM|nr:polysaccharide deacetylase family protein [Cycloclasticus zancles]AGS39777.1 Polysaccharide deacetylase [Cycloclasticus zancles 78-ME]
MKAIITFHSIDTTNSVLSFHPSDFLHLIQSLVESGMPIVTLDNLLDENCSKGVAITFDDGMASVFTEALPVLKDFSVPAHLFLTTSVVGGDNYWQTQPKNAPKFQMMDWDQIAACQSAGVSIEAHTHTHPKLSVLTAEQVQDECLLCDEIIEEKLGRKPKYFAYPYGAYDEKTQKFASSQYKATVTTFMGSLSKNDDHALLPRLDSYYLQSNWIHSKLNKLTGKAYIKSRSIIRSIRGHQ